MFMKFDNIRMMAQPQNFALEFDYLVLIWREFELLNDLNSNNLFFLLF